MDIDLACPNCGRRRDNYSNTQTEEQYRLIT